MSARSDENFQERERVRTLVYKTCPTSLYNQNIEDPITEERE